MAARNDHGYSWAPQLFVADFVKINAAHTRVIDPRVDSFGQV
jgi:hypothetical protein